MHCICFAFETKLVDLKSTYINELIISQIESLFNRLEKSSGAEHYKPKINLCRNK